MLARDYQNHCAAVLIYLHGSRSKTFFEKLAELQDPDSKPPLEDLLADDVKEEYQEFCFHRNKKEN